MFLNKKLFKKICVTILNYSIYYKIKEFSVHYYLPILILLWMWMLIVNFLKKFSIWYLDYFFFYIIESLYAKIKTQLYFFLRIRVEWKDR